MKITEPGIDPGQTEVLELQSGKWVFQGGRYIKIVDVANAPKTFNRNRIVVRFTEAPGFEEQSGKAEFVCLWSDFQQYALEVELKFCQAYPDKFSAERQYINRNYPNHEAFSGVLKRLEYLKEK